MPNALLTGVSGLTSHQKMLEVIGNNIANLNTAGFKERRVLFSDLLYETIRSSTNGTNGGLGGVNPAQIGSGSQVAQVNLNMSQGNFEATGQATDLAIDGDGFFIVQSGTEQLYTRAGTFRVDADGYLVDPSTGYHVQRFGSLGEADGLNPAFQVSSDNNIRIPFGASVVGQATSSIRIAGNLQSTATGPQREILSTSPFLTGGIAATAATLLNDLDLNANDYVSGDSIEIIGTDVDGTAIRQSIPVDATTTVQNFLDGINAAYSGATATLDPDGRIVLSSDTLGPAELGFSLTDTITNTGLTRFDRAPVSVQSAGKDGDKVVAGVEVFDARGGGHHVSLEFKKQADGTWDMTALMDARDGTLTDNVVRGIRFMEDGSFFQSGTPGIGDSMLQIQFLGQAAPQNVSVAFGDAGSFDGLTELATSSSLSAEQNGFAPGALVSVMVRSDGVVEGVASNGRHFSVAQLALASFRNPGGLVSRGNNYFGQSLSSGEVEVGTAMAGNRGSIRAGQVEQSNVDIATEFTRLIVAQRGFSANARTITVTDQMLEELTNLVR